MDEIIDKIRNIRSANNIKWMEILSIALRAAPEETKQVLREINRNDQSISDHLEEIINE